MKKRIAHSMARWGAFLGGTVFGWVTTAMAARLLVSHLSLSAWSVMPVSLIAIFLAGGVCGPLAAAWADQFFKERE